MTICLRGRLTPPNHSSHLGITPLTALDDTLHYINTDWPTGTKWRQSSNGISMRFVYSRARGLCDAILADTVVFTQALSKNQWRSA